jgi:glycosyltransferase involved in cell wall biosynthesis
MRCTFAVVGHNEVERLALAVELALEAARPGDRVWFVDSASDDGSGQLAASLGAEVVAAPIGKGAAMVVALERCRDDYLCFVDADIEHAASNFPLRLREAIEDDGVDMVVGEFDEPARRLTLTPALYRPMVGELFPESVALDIHVPLCGFRVLRADQPWGQIPPGYGVETHLNLVAGVMGYTVANCPLGLFRGPLRGYRNVADTGVDLAAAVLDYAEELGRLPSSARPAWNAWVGEVIELVKRQPPEGADDKEFMLEVAALARRPLPPR